MLSSVKIEAFQYITHPGIYSYEEQVSAVLNGGAKWIQFRDKELNGKEFINTAGKIQSLCRRHKAVFIINDRVKIAAELNADGVHIGKEDVHPEEARKLLGEHKIIGVTANTIEDIIELSQYQVDYIGLGPFRFTPTKKNLSPVLFYIY